MPVGVDVLVERISEMETGDEHDELMCSMAVVAEVHAHDAEREHQRAVSVECQLSCGFGRAKATMRSEA